MQLAGLEGELDVLDVPEVALELCCDPLELAVHLGELATLERGDRLGGSGARDDVLTLRVGEHVAVEHRLARAAVAREGDAGPGIVFTRDCSTGEAVRSEEHTSELQSRGHLVCRLLLEKKNKNKKKYN